MFLVDLIIFASVSKYITSIGNNTSYELKFFESQGTSGNHVSKGFCPNCGSGVLSYQKELSHIVFIKAGTLDDSSWVKVDSNFFTDSASKWSEPDKSIKSFIGNPSLMSNIKTLLKSF